MADSVELERKIAILSACITLLAMKQERRTRLAAGRNSINNWIVAARLDDPSEDWRTQGWGNAHEEEV